MQVQDLSSLAQQLREQGLEARNLAQVGITIWEGPHGCFLAAEELRMLAGPLSPHDFYLEVRSRVRANGGVKTP